MSQINFELVPHCWCSE